MMIDGEEVLPLCLNAPDGAGCSLTNPEWATSADDLRTVLMHLMVLGAP